MGTADGAVLGLTKILDNGPNSSRFNLVLVGEGFQVGQQATFDARCADFITTLQAEPWYPVLGGAINVHRLNVRSDDPGADDPATCPDGATGSGTMADTYFDATYCSGGIRRCLTADWTLVRSALTAALPQWHTGAVIVNTTEHGGCASGNVFATALAVGWQNVIIHELGHAAFGLADEYAYWEGCGTGEAGRDNAPAGEPMDRNITAAQTRATLKWRHLVRPEIPIPTMENPDCTDCDSTPNVLSDDLTIGTFEGAKYYHCGYFRPAFDCMMRGGPSFCDVCVEAVVERFAEFKTPTPRMRVVTTDGSLLLEFGEVVRRRTMYREFEVRNVRMGFPGPIRVTLSPPSGGFTYAPGTETSFMLAAPVLVPYTSRRVYIAFASPTTGGPEFFGSLDVSTPDDAVNPSDRVDCHATAVDPQPIDSVLVIDRSGSMSEPSGAPGRTKTDIAIEASQLYVSLLRRTDRIGVVRYSSASVDPGDVLLAMTEAGPASGGAGRAAANAVLTPTHLAPSGSTSIGSGIIRGSAVLDGGSSPRRAIVVLTDGIQNTPPDIPTARTTVTGKVPRQRVFAVGLGLNQLEDRLHEIASVTNGVAQITGDLVGSREFLLQKLYIQILSDVSDEAFVRDPISLVLPGEQRATDVLVGEIDRAADFILVARPASLAGTSIRVWLEAPDGSLIRPADTATLPNLEVVGGASHGYFRVAFPIFPDRPGAHVGRWRVWVENAGFRGAGALTHGFGTAGSGGAPFWYSVMAKAESDLLLRGRVEQTDYAPGTPMQIVLEPTLFGVPVALDEPVEVRVSRPDGAVQLIALAGRPDGTYAGEYLATGVVGPYLFSAEVSAKTPQGHSVTRYRQMTGITFRPGRGDGHDGQDGQDGGRVDERCCREMRDRLRALEQLLDDCCREGGGTA